MSPIITPGGSGGGGSRPGTPQVVGPITVLYSDLPNSGDRFNLITLPVGSAVLDWWIDPDTLVAFLPDNNDMRFGQGATWEPDLTGTGNGQLGSFNNSLAAVTFGSAQAISGGRHAHAGFVAKSPLLVTQDATPVQVVPDGGIATPYTQGRFDWYVLVVRPPFGTP